MKKESVEVKKTKGRPKKKKGEGKSSYKLGAKRQRQKEEKEAEEKKNPTVKKKVGRPKLTKEEIEIKESKPKKSYYKKKYYKRKTGSKVKTEKQKDKEIIEFAKNNVSDKLCCGDCAFFKECHKNYDQQKTDTIDECDDFRLSTHDAMGHFRKGMKTQTNGMTRAKRFISQIAKRCGPDGNKIVDFHLLVMTGHIKGASISERQDSANWLANRWAGKEPVEAKIDINETITVEQKIANFVQVISDRRKEIPGPELNAPYKLDNVIDADYKVKEKEKVKEREKETVSAGQQAKEDAKDMMASKVANKIVSEMGKELKE